MIALPTQTIQRMLAISLVGLVAGLIAAFATVGFVELVHWLNRALFVTKASRATLEPLQLWWVSLTVLGGGGLFVGLILQYGTDRGQQTGPADTIFALQLQERLPSPLSGISSVVAAILSLGCGASVGQYGPLVYLGTLVGQLTNRLPFGLRDIRNIAVACGVAAAISTAFNAPIAALIFTHEVVLRHYSLRMFTAVTVASACGYLVANVVFDFPPLLLVEFSGGFRGAEFLLFALEGIACGLLAVVFLKLLQRATDFAAELRLAPALKPMLAGLCLALVAVQLPEVLGAGQEVFRQATAGGIYGAPMLLLILVVKLLVTVMCIGFGFAGGVIFPSLLIGVLFGALFAELVPATLLSDYSGLTVYAICGMVALMSPVIGAPMTALLLVFELTRSYEITVAAMVAIVFANLIAFKWYGRSLYDHQLAQRGIDLSLGRERAYLMHHRAVDSLTDAIPVVDADSTLAQVRDKMTAESTAVAVVVDAGMRYLGQVSQRQLQELDDGLRVGGIELQRGGEFDQTTSLWDAMQTMRDFVGAAIPVVDSSDGRYLGAIPEAVVINAYLNATEELRREEHEV